FSANLVKIVEGGWVPILIAMGIFTLMTTWKRGRHALREYAIDASMPLESFLEDVAMTKPHRVSGTAVFMTSNPEGAPPVLLHHFKHNKVLHEQVVCLSIMTFHVPDVPGARRLEL